MAEDFRTIKVKKIEGWYTLTVVLKKPIEQPMEATRLNKAQQTQVMEHLLSIALQNSGITKKFPRVMVYTFKKYHALGLKYPWYS